MISQTHMYRKVRKKQNVEMSLCLGVRLRRSIVVYLALVTVSALFFLTTVTAQANTVTINDQAGVLNTGSVQAEAAQLPVPILIFTTNTFTGGQDELNQFTREQLPDQDTIAIGIGIDTAHGPRGHGHISIQAGTNVYLSNSQASAALSAFQSKSENGGDFTAATIAVIDSLQSALSEGGSSPSGITPFGVAVVILLGIAVIVFIMFAIRRRGRGGSTGGPWHTSDESELGAERELSYFGGVYPQGQPPMGNYGGDVSAGIGGNFGGGASGGFGGGGGGAGGSGGGAGGSFGGGSTGGGAGGPF